LSMRFPKLREGNQVLWQRIAEQHNVLFRTPVKKLKRGKRVWVETPSGTLEFDKLIWAAPVDEFLQVADATHNEMNLFGKVRFLKRAVVTARIEGMPPSRYSYLLKNTVEHQVPISYPYAVYEVLSGSQVYNLYPYMHEDTSVEELVHHAFDLARRM